MLGEETKRPIPDDSAESEGSSAVTRPSESGSSDVPSADDNTAFVSPPGHIFQTYLTDQVFTGLYGSHLAHKNAFFGKSLYYLSETGEEVDERDEHRKTRQLIVDQLELVAKKQDLIDARDQTILTLTNEINELESRLDRLASEVAKTKELEACARALCDEIKAQADHTRADLTAQLLDLRRYLGKFAPYRRYFRATFGFLCFLVVAFMSNSLLGVRIIEPFWAAIGITLSVAMLIVIYFGMKDTTERDSQSKND